MLRTVDIGNTNVTLGAYDGSVLSFTARLATEQRKTDDQYAVEIKNLLSLVRERFFVDQFSIHHILHFMLNHMR